MLTEFSKQLKEGSGDEATKSPPFVIRAGDLDRNFRICSPMERNGPNDPYRVVRPAGPDQPYKLEGQKAFDVCENGQPAVYLFFASRVF